MNNMCIAQRQILNVNRADGTFAARYTFTYQYGELTLVGGTNTDTVRTVGYSVSKSDMIDHMRAMWDASTYEEPEALEMLLTQLATI